MNDNTALTIEDQAKFKAPRLPYHNAIEERYGVDRSAWKSLIDAIYPSAKTVDAVVLALSYCKARNLDPFKRPVHIVPVWDSNAGAMVETVWPGISELRTTAFRTGQYAGCDEVEFGPEWERTFKGTVGKRGSQTEKTVKVFFPEWARMTIYRVLNGNVCKFVGPKTLWLENYGSMGQTDVPNDMWAERPYAQLEKCAEAAALRRAFPEEIGNDSTAEEMEGRRFVPIHQPIEPLNAALTDQSEDGAVATFKALKETKAKKGKAETVQDTDSGIAMTITKNSDTAPISVPAPEIVHVDSLNYPQMSEATETASIPEATQEVQDAVDALVEDITVDSDGVVTITQEPATVEEATEPETITENAAPEVEPETPDPFEPLWSGLMGVPNWISAKTVIVNNTTRLDGFNALPELEQQAIRRKVWLMASQAGWQDGPDEKSDPTAWRLWVDAQDGETGAIAIEATTRVLRKEAKYEKLTDDQKANMKAIQDAAIARCNAA